MQTIWSHESNDDPQTMSAAQFVSVAQPAVAVQQPRQQPQVQPAQPQPTTLSQVPGQQQAANQVLSLLQTMPQHPQTQVSFQQQLQPQTGSAEFYNQLTAASISNGQFLNASQAQLLSMLSNQQQQPQQQQFIRAQQHFMTMQQMQQIQQRQQQQQQQRQLLQQTFGQQNTVNSAALMAGHGLGMANFPAVANGLALQQAMPTGSTAMSNAAGSVSPFADAQGTTTAAASGAVSTSMTTSQSNELLSTMLARMNSPTMTPMTTSQAQLQQVQLQQAQLAAQQASQATSRGLTAQQAALVAAQQSPLDTQEQTPNALTMQTLPTRPTPGTQSAVPASAATTPTSTVEPALALSSAFTSPANVGPAVLRLVQYSDRLASSAEQRQDINYWRRFCEDFYADRGIMQYGLWNAKTQEKKSFEIDSATIANFYQTNYCSGVQEIHLLLTNAREYVSAQQTQCVECPRAMLIYIMDDGSQIHATGHLRVHFNNELKIERYEFDTQTFTETVPRSWLQQVSEAAASAAKPARRKKPESPASSPANEKMSLGAPASRVNDYGLTPEAMRALEMSEAGHRLNDIMQLAINNDQIPPTELLRNYSVLEWRQRLANNPQAANMMQQAQLQQLAQLQASTNANFSANNHAQYNNALNNMMQAVAGMTSPAHGSAQTFNPAFIQATLAAKMPNLMPPQSQQQQQQQQALIMGIAASAAGQTSIAGDEQAKSDALQSPSLVTNLMSPTLSEMTIPATSAAGATTNANGTQTKKRNRGPTSTTGRNRKKPSTVSDANADSNRRRNSTVKVSTPGGGA